LRVLHLVKTPSGAFWALRVMKELVKLGVEVHVAMPPKGRYTPEYEAAGIPIHPQEFDLSPAQLPKHGYAFRQLVKKVQPDIIHSWFAQTTMYMRFFLRDIHIPRIFQVPGPLHLQNPFYRKADVRSATKDDYWIGTSKCINQFYIDEGVDKERLALVYLGVDLNDYEPKPPGFLRQNYPIPEDRKLIGIVAYIYPPNKMLFRKRGLKGHEDLIDAFSILLKKRNDIHLVICGKVWGGQTWYEDQIKAYAKEKCGEHVTFTGFVDDVREVFADLDVFVYPSHSENLGGVFESLLLKVPTAASNIGGIPEAVIHNQTGLLFDPNNHAQIAYSIDRLLENPELANTFVEKGYEHIRSIIDLKKSIPPIVSFYEKLLSS